MEIVCSSLPGRWQIVSNEPSFTLSKISRNVPGLAKLDSRTFEGYSDSVTLAVESMTRAGLRFDSSKFVLKEPGAPLAPVANQKVLRDYQKDAVNFLIAKGAEGCLLADTMGLGKTATALTAARCLDSRTLVICPSYVRGVWFNAENGGEVRKWWPGVEGRTFLPAGVKNLPPIKYDAQLIVIHPDILYAWADAICEWGPRVCVFDEAHMFSNESSRQSKSALKVSARAELRWALTGTPLTNRPRDLHNLVELISPGRFGNFFNYGLKYCDAHKEDVTPTKTVWVFNGKSNIDELHARLKHFTLRRTLEDVGLQLPPKTRQTIWVDVKAKGAICVTEDKRALREALDRSADAKVGSVVELVLDSARSGNKVAVACWRRHVAEHIFEAAQKEGIETGVVHGGVSSKSRGKTIERLRGHKGGCVLATTIDATAFGVDLTFCNEGIFAEFTYEPHEILQWEARFHRPGQVRPVFIKFVVARGTSDELICKAILDKLDTFTGVVGKVSGGDLREALEQSADDAMKEIYAAIAEMQNRG